MTGLNYFIAITFINVIYLSSFPNLGQVQTCPEHACHNLACVEYMHAQNACMHHIPDMSVPILWMFMSKIGMP